MEIPSPTADPLFVFTPPAPSGQAAAGRGTPPGSHDGSLGGPARDAAGGDQATRREISAILRELAAAVGSDRQTKDYAGWLVRRIAAATAAETVVLWDLPVDDLPVDSTAEQLRPRLSVAARSGDINPRRLTRGDRLDHRRLIAEVMVAEAPVVVPPEPGGLPRDPDDEHAGQTGRNPYPMPIAIVPVVMPHRIDRGYAIEVLLDDGAPPGSWKGYLRFLKPVADLAGQFFVIAHLRRITRAADYSVELAAINHAIPASSRSAEIRERFVDGVAEQFDLHRLAWVVGDRVLAVSHCETINPAARGTQTLTHVAMAAHRRPSDAPRGWIPAVPRRDGDDDDGDDDDGDDDTPAVGWVTVPTGRGVTLIIETPLSADEKPADEREDSPDAGTSGVGDWRDGGPRVADGAAANHSAADRWISIPVGDLIDETFLPPLANAARHAALGASLASRLDRIPLGRYWIANDQDHERSTRWTAVSILLGCIGLLLVITPMPRNVLAPFTLSPAGKRIVVAPRDALVQTVHVRHGQRVEPGDPLVTLRDPMLTERRLELSGQRELLAQRLHLITLRQIDPDAARDQQSDLRDQQRSLEVQMATIDRQLDSIQSRMNDLRIVAPVAGVVDRWRIESELVGGAVRRGESLMVVAQADGDWLATARVPRRRMGWIHRATRQNTIAPRIEVDGGVAGRRDVAFSRVGPPIEPEPSWSPTTGGEHRVEFRLAAADFPVGDAAWRDGATGQMQIRCGTISLGRLLLGDSADWVADQASGWLGIWRESGPPRRPR